MRPEKKLPRSKPKRSIKSSRVVAGSIIELNIAFIAMPTVTNVFARVMAQAAGMTLTSDGALLSDGVVIRRFFIAEKGRLQDFDYFEILECIRETRGDDVALLSAYADLGHLDNLGVLGLAIKTAPTLRQSLKRVERFFRLVTDTASYHLDEAGDPAFFVFKPQAAHNRTLEFRNEAALTGFAMNMRRFAGPQFAIEFVSFRHSCRGDQSRYAALFGSPVHFDADRDVIAVRPEILDLSNRLGDEAVSNFLTGHLETEFQSLKDDTSLGDTLVHRLTPNLSNGLPQAASVAREMGMSERTLYRRLAEDGLTFREVVGRAQSALAQEMLRESNASIAEVAFLTGFSEQSTFTRAFKRWNGQAPAQFRRQATNYRGS